MAEDVPFPILKQEDCALDHVTVGLQFSSKTGCFCFAQEKQKNK